MLELPDRRIRLRTPAVPPPPPLASTAAELARTGPAHRERLVKADRFLDDFEQMDGALRLVRRR